MTGCVSSTDPAGPALIRTEPAPGVPASGQTAAQQRLLALLQTCTRLNNRLAAPHQPAAAEPRADVAAAARAWTPAVDELLTDASAEERLGALATLSDLLPYVPRAEDREIWSAYLRLVVAMESALLDTELQLLRRQAPSSGSVHAAAQERAQAFLADGPTVISARDGRISARALGGGVPIDTAALDRGLKLAGKLRLLGFYVAAARPLAADDALSSSVVRTPRSRVSSGTPDFLRQLTLGDARRLFMRPTGAQAEWSATQARLHAGAAIAALDDAYLVRRERIFAPAYRELKSRLQTAAAP